jgi:hypothetical protein
MWHEWLFLSDYSVSFQMHIGKVITGLDINADVPVMQKLYTKFLSAYCALVNLGSFIVATLLVIGTIS